MSPSHPADGALRILVVHSELPLHDRHSGSLRLFRLLELLAAEGHRVTFLARCGIGQERYAAELAALGIDVHPLDRARLRERGAALPGPELDFAALCARGRFDVALLSFYEVAEQYLPLLRRHSPLTRIAIDTVDVHHVRERRGAVLSGDPAALAAAERTREREQAIYGAADALVAVSEDDAAALRELAPEVPVTVVSNVHAEAPAGPPFEERGGLLFVANFAHAPNVDAILDFHASAWPLVRAALPDARLSLVGSDPPPAVCALAAPDVEVTGWVPETAPYLDRARVSIAPLRYGAGVKGKIGEALSHGLPVVTTPIGAEGMDLRDGEHALIAGTPEGFATAIARLHGDGALWERIAAAGRAHVARRLGRDAARDALRALLRRTARTPFVLGVDPARPDELAHALRGYVDAFVPGDPVSLVLAVPAGDPDAPQAAFDAAAAELARLGRDHDAIPDVSVSPWSPELPLPGGAVAVEAATSWDVRAPATRRRSAPRAAVVLDAGADPATLAPQLDALARAGLPSDTELVIAAGDPSPQIDALLHERASGARKVRAAGTLGRSAAWALAAQSTRAPHVVALAPLAIPAPGFVAPLLDRLTSTGAALAAPVTIGGAGSPTQACCAEGAQGLRQTASPPPAAAHGLTVEQDGSLWPRTADDPTALGALPLDCLAAERTLFADGLPVPPAGEGHREAQLAAWAAQRGGIALAPEASVARLPGPPATVVVCTRNRAAELPGGVALLVASGAQDVVIVDNASTDETADVAAELAARFPGVVRVVEEPRAGLCHARNAGAAAARHDLLLYVDDDARVAPGWLEHVSHALARPGVVNAGGPICALWPPEREAGWPGRDVEALLSVLDLGDAERTLSPPDVVYGANWAVRRDALRAVGGFDPAFGPGPGAAINGDEVSVAWRLHRAGAGATVYVPGAAVGHRIGAERVDERFLAHRALCVGVERPRHAAALGEAPRERLLADAQAATGRLLAAVPLGGALTVGDVLDRVAATPLPLGGRVQAAMALGELAACVLLLGEHEVVAGELTLAVHDELLHGALAPASAAA